MTALHRFVAGFARSVRAALLPLLMLAPHAANAEAPAAPAAMTRFDVAQLMMVPPQPLTPMPQPGLDPAAPGECIRVSQIVTCGPAPGVFSVQLTGVVAAAIADGTVTVTSTTPGVVLAPTTVSLVGGVFTVSVNIVGGMPGQTVTLSVAGTGDVVPQNLNLPGGFDMCCSAVTVTVVLPVACPPPPVCQPGFLFNGAACVPPLQLCPFGWTATPIGCLPPVVMLPPPPPPPPPSQVGPPNLTVTKSGPATCVLGQPCSYQITVTNTGKGPFTGNLTLDEQQTGLYGAPVQINDPAWRCTQNDFVPGQNITNDGLGIWIANGTKGSKPTCVRPNTTLAAGQSLTLQANVDLTGAVGVLGPGLFGNPAGNGLPPTMNNTLFKNCATLKHQPNGLVLLPTPGGNPLLPLPIPPSCVTTQLMFPAPPPPPPPPPPPQPQACAAGSFAIPGTNPPMCCPAANWNAAQQTCDATARNACAVGTVAVPGSQPPQCCPVEFYDAIGRTCNPTAQRQSGNCPAGQLQIPGAAAGVCCPIANWSAGLNACVVPDQQPPKLSIVKNGPTLCMPGQPCRYLITVTNDGPGVYQDTLIVTDGLNAPVGVLSTTAADPSWQCSPSGQVVTCQRPNTVLQPGQSMTLEILVQLNQQPTATVYKNCAVIGPRMPRFIERFDPLSPRRGFAARTGPDVDAEAFGVAPRMTPIPAAVLAQIGQGAVAPPIQDPTESCVTTSIATPGSPPGPSVVPVPLPPSNLVPPRPPQRLCPPGYSMQGSRCVVVCRQDQAWDGQRCVNLPRECRPGQAYIGGRCRTLEPLCPPGSRWDGEYCEEVLACPPGTRATRDGCVPNVVYECRRGEIFDRYLQRCVREFIDCPPSMDWNVQTRRCEIVVFDRRCRQDEVWNGEFCVPRRATCRPNETFDFYTRRCEPRDTPWGCREGERWNGERCVPERTLNCGPADWYNPATRRCEPVRIEPRCRQGEFWNGARCVPQVQACRQGEIWNGQRCVPGVIPQQCRDGEIWNGVRCERPANPQACRQGEVWNGQRCERPANPQACRQGEIWNGQRCVPGVIQQQCRDGELWNGQRCVPTSPATPNRCPTGQVFDGRGCAPVPGTSTPGQVPDKRLEQERLRQQQQEEQRLRQQQREQEQQQRQQERQNQQQQERQNQQQLQQQREMERQQRQQERQNQQNQQQQQRELERQQRQQEQLLRQQERQNRDRQQQEQQQRQQERQNQQQQRELERQQRQQEQLQRQQERQNRDRQQQEQQQRQIDQQQRQQERQQRQQEQFQRQQERQQQREERQQQRGGGGGGGGCPAGSVQTAQGCVVPR